jgi:hypothetical protein
LLLGGAFLAREEVLAEVPVGGVEDAHRVEIITKIPRRRTEKFMLESIRNS